MEDNIKIAHRAIIRQGADWIHLVRDTYQWQAAANMVMNIRFTTMKGFTECLRSYWLSWKDSAPKT
jgi:hypothetical protein